MFQVLEGSEGNVLEFIKGGFKMKKMFRCLTVVVFALATFILGSAVVFAAVDADEIPGENSKSITDVLAELESKGYAYISSIEFDDYVWKVKTLSNGQETKYRVDPVTLIITRIKTEKEDDLQPPEEARSLKEALDLVYKKGYEIIRAIEFDKGRWEVNVIDNNVERELIIDPDTKKVLFDRVDN